jgi:hypothetical protein
MVMCEYNHQLLACVVCARWCVCGGTAGTWHSLVLTKEGRCYTFGTGRASLGSKDTAWQPTIVPGLEDQKVIAMAGGDDHRYLACVYGGAFVRALSSIAGRRLAYLNRGFL